MDGFCFECGKYCECDYCCPVCLTSVCSSVCKTNHMIKHGYEEMSVGTKDAQP